MWFLHKESLKYFEDDKGFVYKRVNSNDKTVYLDCINEPRCLVAARFYKQSKQFRVLGNHFEECAPDEKVKMKIHFEEFLKKSVIEEENAAISVLNLYKRAAEERYKGIWFPENHRTNFLLVLRRIRSNRKTTHDKPKNSKRTQTQKCDVATSPILVDIQEQAAALPSPTAICLNESENANAKASTPSTSGSICDKATSPMLPNGFTPRSIEVQNDPTLDTINDDSTPLIVFSPVGNESCSVAAEKINI